MTKHYDETKKLKVFLINRILKLQKEQNELFDELKKENSKGEFLTVKQVLNEFNISRSTFDRWRAKGLKVYQDKPKATIRAKKNDVLKFIN